MQSSLRALNASPDHKDDDSSELADTMSVLCKAGADRLRLDILAALNKESFGVLELCRIFNMKQSGMSHHLKVLANAGLVTTRREGNTIFYRRNHQALNPLLNDFQQSLFASVDQLNLSAEARGLIDELQQERRQSSLQFFAQNADKFREQQDLIASYEQYAESVYSLIDSLDELRHGHAVEIGPGEGAFLAELSPRFEHVTAVDNSTEMLEKARTFVHEQGLQNITLQAGDTQDALRLKLAADCIVVNMVLHHTPSPADIFADLSQLLKPGGAMIICDLCHHDQNWTRENCGDLWLGFAPEDLSEWARAAGLSEGKDMYLTLRNGFRIQVRHFYQALSSSAKQAPKHQS